VNTDLSGTVASVVSIIVAKRFRRHVRLGLRLVEISVAVYPRMVRRHTCSSTKAFVLQLVEALALLTMDTQTTGMHPRRVYSLLTDKIRLLSHIEERVLALLDDAILDLLTSQVVTSSHLKEVAARTQSNRDVVIRKR
jgi:hypothetical protein